MKLDQSLALAFAITAGRRPAVTCLSAHGHRHDTSVDQFKRFSGENL